MPPKTINRQGRPSVCYAVCASICIAVLGLSSCSGGGTSGSGGASSGDGLDQVGQPLPELTDQVAARLLTQATFGTTMADIARVKQFGIQGWIDDQFTQQGSAHLDWVQLYSNGSGRGPRHEIWWIDAIRGTDQLRQRVAFALSQIFVVSDTGYTLSNSQYGITNFYDILRRNAFGSYRTLLEEVTLSPVMGLYLSMLQNARADPAGNTRPDENFAREVMQLFSIGLYQLNPDGTQQRSNGQPIPAYTQADIENYARVFTGWTYKDTTAWDRPSDAGNNRVDPMEPYPGYHDTGSKTLLGGIQTAAGNDERQDLTAALDSLANHPNVGPFIGRRLIQHLVTSNPTPQFIARVTATFNDNGQGIRGDLQAVVRAILLDPEALHGHKTLAAYGKLREPLLRISHLWRAFNAIPGTNGDRGEYVSITPYAYNLELATGQAPLKSASVFNFYSPDYAPLGPIYSQGLVAPVSEIYTDNNILSTTSHLNVLTQRFYLSSTGSFARNLTHIDLTTENALAADPGALLDRLNLLLMSGSMTNAMRAILTEHIQALPDTTEGRSQRARDAISLIMASPDYLVQQ